MRVQAAFLLGVVVLCAGCAKPDAQLIGKWQVDTSTAKADGPAGQMVNQFAKAFTVEFNADKTFNMTMIFPMSGTWSMSGHNVDMHMTSVMGMDPSKMKDAGKGDNNTDLHMTLSDDGKSLTTKDDKGGKQTKFIRATS